jgi:allantoinase
METLGARAKVNPPLRSSEERDALWEYCTRGSIDMITSDHAPWAVNMKSNPNIFRNKSGLPGVEVLLPMMYSEGVAKGKLRITDLARLVSQMPAKVFGLGHRKGQIRVGADADLAILRTDAEWVIDQRRLFSSAGWSPYNGWQIKGEITMTILRGQVVFENGAIVCEPGVGQFVAGNVKNCPNSTDLTRSLGDVLDGISPQ